MKKKLAKKHISATNLLYGCSKHILQKNVYLRSNGIFYFRKTIRGRQVVKSLQTKDPLLAVFLTNRLREKFMSSYIDDIILLLKGQSDPEIKKQKEAEFLKRAEKANRKYEISILSQDPDYIKRKQLYLSLYPDKNEDYIYDHLEELYSDEINSKLTHNNIAIIPTSTVNSTPKETHNLLDLWKKYRYEHYIKDALLDLQNMKIEDIDNKSEEDLIKLLDKHHYYELNRHDTHMKLILSILPKTIEEIDTKPIVLKELMQKLYTHEYKPGKYWASGTLDRVLEPIKGILQDASTSLIIQNYAQYQKNLNIEAYKVKQPDKEREPFNKDELTKIFKMLVDLHKHDFTFIKEAQQDPNNPIHKEEQISTIIKKRKEPTLLELYPEPIVYAALIALYSGCRANASSTIRFINVDIENKTISIEFDDDDNIRAQEKHLKASKVSKASLRTIPWPPVLIDLGFEKYIKQCQRKYGVKAYVFEGILRTNKKDPNKLTYDTSRISDIFRLLLRLLKIKPDVDTGIMKDFHSLKTTFYTYNQSLPSQSVVRALAGNKQPKNASVEDASYKSSTFDLMQDVMNQIHYPGEEILLNYIKTLK